MSRHHGQAGHESVVADQTRSAIPQVALVGNPNAGKTTLFNRLTGLRAKTSNFSGTTIERHAGRLELGNRSIELLDLPGLYGLEAATAEEIIARAVIVGEDRTADRASLALVVIDATNLARNLF